MIGGVVRQIGSKVGRGVRTHPIRAALALVVLLAGCGYAWSQVRPFVGLPDREVSRTLPSAPELTAGPGETIYRIDATGSSASYAVEETIAGQGAGTAEGTTQAIAGDIALNRGRPAESRVGDIVIDLRQLRSDNSLRDRRIRADFLASDDHPLARFATTSVEGMPATLPETGDITFTLVGDLTVKETTLPAEWDVTARMVGEELTATATTVVAMSAYDIGPISIAGLVRTEDEVTLTLELVAADPTKRAIPNELPPLASDEERAAGGPSFAREVQPILEANCASCHNDGQIGAHALGLDTAGDASEYADGIAIAVNAGYMPPWPASDVGIPLRHPRTLSDEDIATIRSWADAGGALDVADTTPLEPVVDPDVPTPREDLTLRMADAYTGSVENPNDYRCFTMDPGFTEPTYMTGYSFVPDELSVVHHALVYKVDAEAHEEAIEKEGEDGRPGWECYVGTGLRTAPALDGGLEGKSDLVAGWVPGQRPLDFGDDRGFLFEPGDVLITQIHYHYDHADAPADQSELRLQLMPGDAPVRALEVANPIAPVEIPCPEGADGPLCDRDAALARILEEYGPIAGAIPGAVLEACDREIEEYADQTDGIGSTSCDYEVHGSGEIIDVLGHMHEIGRSFRMTLNPGTPGEKVLLDIPTWNFDWQLNYQPVEEVRVEEGDTLRIECTWDRGLRYDEEPKYLLFAEGTEDEMCFSTYTLLPDEE